MQKKREVYVLNRVYLPEMPWLDGFLFFASRPICYLAAKCLTDTDPCVPTLRSISWTFVFLDSPGRVP